LCDEGFELTGRILSRLLRTLYGIYALSAFSALFLLAAVLTLIAPTLEWRRRLAHWFAGLGLTALFIRVSLHGEQNLPTDSCIVVANHSSYLDGIILKAVLPPRFSFVIKQEAASTPLLGMVLKRIGSEFIDRNSHSGRQRDARRVMRKAAAGHSLVFFPEGTFFTEPGLRRFLSGAFVAAAKSDLPVVPVVIHGARRALPNRAIVPRPGTVRVEILPARTVADSGSIQALRDDSRLSILARLDEPDAG
jgi:1-acyl-sn-glycerol-3-phosphate acyltransferase